MCCRALGLLCSEERQHNIQEINNSGADKDCGIITHIKTSAEKASTESDLTDSAGLPGLDMILPKTHHWASQQGAKTLVYTWGWDNAEESLQDVLGSSRQFPYTKSSFKINAWRQGHVPASWETLTFRSAWQSSSK